MRRLHGRMTGFSAVLVLAVAALANGPSQAVERQTPSGFAVPRYVTLKFAKVNARKGPGDDHKLLFVYLLYLLVVLIRPHGLMGKR